MRSVEEWKGATDDTPIPSRVRARVFEHFMGVCQCGCGRRIQAGERWDVDHIIAIGNGGANAEGNLQPLLLAHHKVKTRQDMAIKSKIARIRARHLGIKRSTSRPIPGSKASGIRKRMNGQVEKWT